MIQYFSVHFQWDDFPDTLHTISILPLREHLTPAAGTAVLTGGVNPIFSHLFPSVTLFRLPP